MSAPWTWILLDSRGEPLTVPTAPRSGFPTQSDAESYVGESWRELLEAGVEAVTLCENETVVYGPMSLRPAE